MSALEVAPEVNHVVHEETRLASRSALYRLMIMSMLDGEAADAKDHDIIDDLPMLLVLI